MYQLEGIENIREIRRGEIYFVDLTNIEYMNSHIAGKSRPGLVIQNNIGNENSHNVIVALLTSADKRPYPFQYKIILNGRPSTIMFDQIMTLPREKLQEKLGELTDQEIYESDLSLMCSLELLPHSMTTIKDFNIISMITEKTRKKEKTYCNVDILNIINDKEIISDGKLFLEDIKSFDSSITKDTDLDNIKDKLNNCSGLNFLVNHIRF